MAIDWFEFFSPHIEGLKPGRNDWAKGKCRWHEDRRASFGLNLKNGSWVCHAGCGKGNAKALCKKMEIDYPLARRGTPKRSGKPPQSKPREYRPSQSPTKIIATYIYTDEKGQLLFRKHRSADKNFWFERPDGKGAWIPDLEGTRIVPYRLHEIIRAQRVCIVEGCKDANTLHAMEFVATTAPFGADRWPEEFAQHFTGKELWVFRDNDKPGKRHQLEAALNCFPTAKSVKLIELPGLAEKEDITDWCNKPHTKEELLKIANATAALKEEDLPLLRDELKELKSQTKTPRKKKIETGEEILAQEDPQPQLHPAMDWREGDLILGFRYGTKSLWITSKRKLLSQAELKETYGEPKNVPAGKGPSKQACERWLSGEQVHGRVLFRRVRDFLLRYVVFQYPWQPDLATLWVLNTYLYRIFPVCPYLHVTAPDKESGKTRFLDVTRQLSFGHPHIQVDPSEAVLFREPEVTALSLFWDEAERLRQMVAKERDERISVLNAGYSRGAVVQRYDNNTNRIIAHEVFRPTILCGINRLPDTTASRCLNIALQRRKLSEKIDSFNSHRLESVTTGIRDDCYLWALQHAPDIADIYRVRDAIPVPEGLNDRLREVIEPLFAIAMTLAEAHYDDPIVTALTDAARHLSGDARAWAEEDSTKLQALRIISEKFPANNQDWLLKGNAWFALCHENDMAWIKDELQAKRILNAWGLKSAPHRTPDGLTRGYLITRPWLKDKIERYAPSLSSVFPDTPSVEIPGSD